MPGTHQSSESDGRPRRRTREQRRRESERANLSDSQPPLNVHTPLPIVHQGELGSAATMSTLARHRMSRRRDHDPLGMTVQQAVEQLGEHNDTLNAALRQPLPEVSDEVRNQDSGEPRRKRRKRDADPVERREIPQYGFAGRVVPGRLQMQVLTCDCGEHRPVDRGDLQVENILLDDESTYCSESPKCNIVLKHRGETPFSLTRLVIKNPRKADAYSSRLQEGLVFVSMSVDDLQFRTERYDLVKDPLLSASDSSTEDLPSNRQQQRDGSLIYLQNSARRAPRPLHEIQPPRRRDRPDSVPRNAEEVLRQRQTADDRLDHELYDRYRAVHGSDAVPHSLSEAQAIQHTMNSLENAEARLRELVRRNDAILRYNSWQQIEPDAGSARVSTTVPQRDPTDTPTSPEASYAPSFQGFDVIAVDDVQDAGLDETAFRLWRERLMAMRDAAEAHRSAREAHEAREQPWGIAPSGTTSILGLPQDQPTHPHINRRREGDLVTLQEFLSEEEETTTALPPGALPSMRMEPNDEHPMYGDGTHIRRANRRPHAGHLSQPRKVQWIPNKIKRSDMGRGATGDEVLEPHAHFFIKKGKDSVALEFSPPVSGRYILLKLWAPPGNQDIDVQSIQAYGYAGARMFRATQMR